MNDSDLVRFMTKAEWMADANCLGVDQRVFFPERGEVTSFAKSICRACDVQAECLAYALNSDEKFGIWGGTSERERRRIRKRRSVIATGPVRRHVPVEEHGTTAGFAQHHRAGTPPLPSVPVGPRGRQAVQEAG